jgi:hypothetical protein
MASDVHDRLIAGLSGLGKSGNKSMAVVVPNGPSRLPSI